MWKFNWQRGRDKWLVLLALGVIVCILAFPVGRQEAGGRGGTDQDTAGQKTMGQTAAGQTAAGQTAAGQEPAGQEMTAAVDGADYERQLEMRLEELLSQVEGVGAVDVMIVLENSGEHVWRVDQASSFSATKETDSSGGVRDIQTGEKEESTVLSGQGEGQGPLLEKEIRPAIGGVVVSAQGGGSPRIQTEISAALEALLSVPAHKIKVLQRKP